MNTLAIFQLYINIVNPKQLDILLGCYLSGQCLNLHSELGLIYLFIHNESVKSMSIDFILI